MNENEERISIRIKNFETDKIDRGYCRRLTIDDLEIITELERKNQVFTGSKDMCVDVTEPEFIRYLQPGQGIYYGAFVNEQLIALFCIIRPVPEENLGGYIGLEGDALNHTANWELAHVLHEYRGNRLQEFLSKLCCDRLKEEWLDVEHLFLTTYPFNFPSIKSTLKYNFVIVGFWKLHSGHDRFLFYRPKTGRIEFDKTNEIIVPIKEFDKFKMYFEDGYVGTELVSEGELRFIKFNKKMER